MAINPGSTSTKIAVYLDETCQFEEVIRHNTDDLASFSKVNDQYDFRRALVEKVLTEHDVSIDQFAAIVGRGGPLKPIPSGTYRVNDVMCEDLRIGVQAEHVSNLGGLLARGIADKVGIPSFIVDPVSVDEFEPLARVTGIPEVSRRSLFHALNLKAAAHQVARDLQVNYQDLTLVMVHLGGGISVGVQRNGKMIDVSNANDSGPFSPERAGSVPSSGLIKLCYSGKYTITDIKKRLVGNAGLVAHLGQNDGQEIERRIAAGDDHAAFIYEAMAYQIAKEIGAMSTVVGGKVDAIVLTGGMANSKILIDFISKRVNFIAKVLVYPGDDELRALVAGTLRVLRGEEDVKHYV